MKRKEWAATLYTFRLAKKNASRGGKLPIPSWVSSFITNKIDLSCQTCQDSIEIQYGSAECTCCPLADFVSRLKVGAGFIPAQKD